MSEIIAAKAVQHGFSSKQITDHLEKINQDEDMLQD